MKSFLVYIALSLLTVVSLSAAESKAPITIGATLSLSGSHAYWGKDAERGMSLAVEEVNAKGGIAGKPLKLVVEDFGDIDLKRAALAAEKLLTVDKVSVLFTLWTEDTAVAAPLAARANTLLLSIAAGGERVSKDNPLVFQIWPHDNIFVRALVDYAWEHGQRKAAIISSQIPYFLNLTQATKDLWEKKTSKEVIAHEVAIDFLDFKPLLLKIKQGEPDVVFLNLTEIQAGTILHQMSQMHLQPMRMRPQKSDVATVIDPAKGNAEGLLFAEYEPAMPQFEKIFKERYGSAPLVCADTAYDAVHLYARVANEKGVATEAVKRVLLAVKEYNGASGFLSFNEDRERIGKKVFIKVIKGGKAQLVKEVQ